MRIHVCFAFAIILIANLHGSHSQNDIAEDPTTSTGITTLAPSTLASPTRRPPSPVRKRQVRCNSSCPRIYRPVCGSFDGVQHTMGNRCMLEVAKSCAKSSRFKPTPKNVKFMHNGRCRREGARRTSRRPRRRTTRRNRRRTTRRTGRRTTRRNRRRRSPPRRRRNRTKRRQPPITTFSTGPTTTVGFLPSTTTFF